MSKDTEFCHWQNIYPENMGKVVRHCHKTELDAAKTDSKIVVHKTAETTEELIGNKIAEKNVKQKPVPDSNSGNVEEIVIPPEKRQEILNEL